MTSNILLGKSERALTTAYQALCHQVIWPHLVWLPPSLHSLLHPSDIDLTVPWMCQAWSHPCLHLHRAPALTVLLPGLLFLRYPDGSLPQPCPVFTQTHVFTTLLNVPIAAPPRHPIPLSIVCHQTTGFFSLFFFRPKDHSSNLPFYIHENQGSEKGSIFPKVKILP